MVNLIVLRHRCDPFTEYPQLNDIWYSPKTEWAALASEDDSETGEVMLISYNWEIVGITGLFINDEDDSDETVHLRWTGVIPEKRRLGITSQALDLLIPVCKEMFPTRHFLGEMVPANDHGEKNVAPFFESYGFVKRGEPYKNSWGVEHKWQDYVLDLRHRH